MKYELHKFPLPKNIEEEYNLFLDSLDEYSPFQSIGFAKTRKNTYPTEEFPYLVLGRQINSISVGAIIIKRKYKLGLEAIRIERGPVFNNSFRKKDFFEFIHKEQSFNNCSHLEIFPSSELKITSIEVDKLKFPSTTINLDISQSENDIKVQMSQKGRYNLNKALKNKDLSARIGGKNLIEEYISLSKLTNNKKGFESQNKIFYQNLFSEFGDNCFCILIDYLGEPICGGIFLKTGNRCTYYVGASNYKFRNLMATYLVQWEAITKSKSLRCTNYDFFGISEDDNNQLSGVTRFKKSFGGKIVYEGKPFLLVLNKYKYIFFKSVKALYNIKNKLFR